jgi:hypothetical protein
VAKSWWKWGLKMEKYLKTGNGSGFLTGNQLIFQNLQDFFTPKPEIQGFYCVFK